MLCHILIYFAAKVYLCRREMKKEEEPVLEQQKNAVLYPQDLFTHPGVGRCNEDAVGGGPGYLYVIDGATGLSDAPPCMARARTDAAWFAGETAKWLDAHLSLDIALDDLLLRGMAFLRTKWKGSGAPPAAGIAVLRCRGRKLELLALGDCLCSIQKRDGSFITVRETSLNRLDTLAREELVAHARHLDCPPAACLPLIQETLRRHRALANRPGGYWVLDPSGAGVLHALRLSVPLETCASVFLCTDGFGQLLDFSGRSLPDLHCCVARQGIAPLAAGLFAWQEADPDFKVVPRFKLRDDTTAAYGDIVCR